MLKTASITNFRCVRKAELSFGPLTVFVGPNASGKSALLDALNPHRELSRLDVWQRRADLPISIQLFHDAGRFSRTLKPSNQQDVDGIPFKHQLLQLDLNALRNLNHVRAQSTLDKNGGNLANVFATLTRRDQADLAAELCRLVPMFADVDVRPSTNPGHQQLVILDRWNREIWYEADQVSDGTMLLLAFLTLQYQNPPIDVVAIEEPERGLHPYLLGELVGVLRRLAHGEIGSRPVQILLATHSPTLLNHLKPDEVRFLSRLADDGAVRVEVPPTDTPDWQDAFQQYQESLGSAWLSGGLGGVPGGS